MDINFRRFEFKSQLKPKRDLFSECFPEIIKDDRNNNYLNDSKYLWQFQSFPGLSKSYEYVAMLGDEMIGYYAALPYRYKIGEEIANTGMVCGVMTSPKYRKMGVFTNLGNFSSQEQVMEGVSFNLTFPIRKAVMPGFLKMGWEIVFELPLYVRFLKLTSLLKKRKIGFLANLFNPILFAFNFICHKSNNKEFEVEIYSKIDDVKGYDDFFKRWSSTMNNTLIKDMTFCKWRYGSPISEYLFFAAYKSGRLVGFVSASPIIKEGVDSFGILDFMVTDEKCLPNLHNAIFNRAKADKKEALIMMMSKFSSKKYLLAKNAYLKSPFKFHLIIKNLSQKFTTAELFKEESWNLMFVDSDDL